MPGEDDELLNVYDAAGEVVGARPRRQAKASGLAVGAVNALVVNGRREVLLQRRPPGKENGGRWDKSVGGHVSAGEGYDACLMREAGEELFDDPLSPRLRLAASVAELAGLAAAALQERVVLCRVALQLNLRDVRAAPAGEALNVLYHVAVYLGRTELPLGAFSPSRSELEDLGYFAAERVDRMLLAGELAPNMAFLWLSQGQALLSLASR